MEVATPSAITGDVPVILELAATAAPAVKTTELPVFTTGVEIARILVSAVVDFRVQIETPEASEAEQRLLTLVEPVSVEVKVGT